MTRPINAPLQSRDIAQLIHAAWDHDLPAICPANVPIKHWSKVAHLIDPQPHLHHIQNGHWIINR